MKNVFSLYVRKSRDHFEHVVYEVTQHKIIISIVKLVIVVSNVPSIWRDYIRHKFNKRNLIFACDIGNDLLLLLNMDSVTAELSITNKPVSDGM